MSTGEHDPNADLLSAEDVRDKLGAPSAKWVLKKTREQGWPCVKFSRVVIRYTPDQVAEIVSRYSQQATAPAKGIPGQTARSKKASA